MWVEPQSNWISSPDSVERFRYEHNTLSGTYTVTGDMVIADNWGYPREKYYCFDLSEDNSLQISKALSNINFERFL